MEIQSSALDLIKALANKNGPATIETLLKKFLHFI